MQPYPSPLRYPGGKRKLANFFKLLLKENHLLDSHYLEPYAGGGSVALSLLYEEYIEHAHINDLNKSVYAFWRCALERTEELVQQVYDTEVTMEEWHRQRSIQEAEDPDLLELGFSTFFLNRTNRSGIIWAGVIGGQQQKGKWKIDARFNKTDLVSRIRKIGRYSGRITITNLDAAIFLKKKLPDLPPKSLLYLDPPYYKKGAGLYLNHYKHDDHAAIATLIQESCRPWAVSYDVASEILRLYEGQQSIQYGISYSAHEQHRGREVIFFSRELTLPEVASPACIPRRLIN